MLKTDRLQALLEEGARRTGVVGAQATVVSEGQCVSLSFGLANAELDTPMMRDTAVQVGSVAKVLNAALIMSLVDEGRIDLDRPVVTYLPDLELADPEARETITSRHLLSMSSGLDNGHAKPVRGDDALGRYVALIRDMPQMFAPGTAFGYSSAGSCIAAYVAERVTGVPWAQLLRQRLIEPAGLTSTVVAPDEAPFHRVAVGHMVQADGKATVTRPWYLSEGAAPGGSTLAASADDLASVGLIFLNEGRSTTGQQVLSKSAVDQMMTATTRVPLGIPHRGIGDMWGLGPTRSEWRGVTAWGHAGGNLSGGSQLVWFPERRAVLAFTLNTMMAFDAFTSWMFSEFSRKALGLAAPDFHVPDTPPPVPDPERYTGTFIRNGVSYEIGERDAGLVYRETHLGLGIPGERTGLAFEGVMYRLRDDAFQVKDAQGRGPQVAFFGRDDEGRATNFVAPMFATKRVYASEPRQ